MGVEGMSVISTLLEGVGSTDGDKICEGESGGTKEELELLLLEVGVSSIFPSGISDVLELEL